MTSFTNPTLSLVYSKTNTGKLDQIT